MLQASDEFWADEHETFVDVAAPKLAESAQHSHQHTQLAKCPSCFGMGRKYNGPYGYSNRPCPDCEGMGIQQAGA